MPRCKLAVSCQATRLSGGAKRAASDRSARPRWLTRVLLLRARLAERLAQLIAPEERIVAESAAAARRFEDPSARRRPRTPRGSPRRARRRPGRSDSAPAAAPPAHRPGGASSSALLAASTSAADPVAPAHRRDRTPGAPPSENTSSPESSATVGRPLRRAKCSALCLALASKVSPVSSRSSAALLVQQDVVGEDDLDAGRLEHPADLPLLSCAAGGGQQLHQPSACRWAAKSSAMPLPARSSRRSSWAREKVPCSPVPCTSTNRSGCSITMLASTAASRSSR